MLFLTTSGAGVLISAAVFQMVIEAEKELGVYPMVAAIVGGSMAFSVADMIAERKGGGKHPARDRPRLHPRGLGSGRINSKRRRARAHNPHRDIECARRDCIV